MNRYRYDVKLIGNNATFMMRISTVLQDSDAESRLISRKADGKEGMEGRDQGVRLISVSCAQRVHRKHSLILVLGKTSDCHGIIRSQFSATFPFLVRVSPD